MIIGDWAESEDSAYSMGWMAIPMRTKKKLSLSRMLYPVLDALLGAMGEGDLGRYYPSRGSLRSAICQYEESGYAERHSRQT